MASQQEVYVDGSRKVATTALVAADQYKFVKLDSNGDVVLCSATTDKPFGVLQTWGAVGDAVVVMRIGRTKLNSDAALSIGNIIGTSADGQAAAYVYGTDTTKYMIGDVIVASAAAAGFAVADINCINPPRGA